MSRLAQRFSREQRDYKAHARTQWTETPCGSLDDPALIPGTKEYFDAVDRDRYERYAPWLPATMGFAGFPRASILEIGYGQGTDLFQFALNSRARVAGLDLSPAHLALASRRFELAGIAADLRLHDAETEWPFPSNSFDLVYSFGVLHHTPQPEKAIAEAYRVLKPGGTILIGLYHRDSLFSLVRFASWLRHGEWRAEAFGDSFWRIEAHAPETTARTLVRRYTRGGMRRLLSNFDSVEVSVNHLGIDLGRRGSFLPHSVKVAAAKIAGWYVIGRGRKN